MINELRSLFAIAQVTQKHNKKPKFISLEVFGVADDLLVKDNVFVAFTSMFVYLSLHRHFVFLRVHFGKLATESCWKITDNYKSSNNIQVNRLKDEHDFIVLFINSQNGMTRSERLKYCKVGRPVQGLQVTCANNLYT